MTVATPTVAPNTAGAKTVSENDLATAFLAQLGAPNTPAMRLAVIVWMRGETGHIIIGNNPFNLRPGSDITLLSSGSRVSPGNGTFATFATPQLGAQAAAQRLASSSSYGYPAVVAAARKGSATGFLTALAASRWSSGGYGTRNPKTGKLTGKTTTLLASYAKAAPPSIDTALPLSGGPVRSTGSGTSDNGSGVATPPAGNLGAWANQVQFPVGHILTAQDVSSIMATLVAQGYFANDPTGAAQEQTQLVLISEIGKPWNKALEQDIQAKLATAATNANPFGGVLGALGILSQIAAALFDPRKWLLILALIAGTALTGWGGVNVLRAAA